MSAVATDNAKLSAALTDAVAVAAKDVKIEEKTIAEKAAAAVVQVETKDAHDTEDDRTGLEVPPEQQISDAFRAAAHAYLDKMFESNDEEEHKACMAGIKMAHGDHMKYKELGGDDEVEEGSDEDSEPSDNAKVEEKAFAELITKAVQEALAPVQAKLDQVEAWQNEFGTAEELAEVLEMVSKR